MNIQAGTESKLTNVKSWCLVQHYVVFRELPGK